jgi:hypothetical protein
MGQIFLQMNTVTPFERDLRDMILGGDGHKVRQGRCRGLRILVDHAFGVGELLFQKKFGEFGDGLFHVTFRHGWLVGWLVGCE